MMDPQQLADLRSAVNISEALPSILPELDGMEKSIITKAFTDLNKGALTPEASMAYWMELHSIHRLRQRLNAKAAPAHTVTQRSITNGQG